MNKLKALMEKRAAIIASMRALADLVSNSTETRAFTDEEKAQFEDLKKQLEDLNATIAAIEATQNAENTEEVEDAEAKAAENTEEAEVRALAAYLTSGVAMNTRAATNIEANGAVVPVTVANKIIKRVREMSPICNAAIVYHNSGTVAIPYYDEETSSVAVGFAVEFVDLTASGGSLKSVNLGAYLIGALAKVSKTLVNNKAFDIVSFVVEDVAEKLVAFIEKACLLGATSSTGEKILGCTEAKVITAESATVIDADELIDIQCALPSAYQSNSMWVMGNATLSAVRKLKDGMGNYLLQADSTTEFGFSIYGKPVYVTDALDGIEADKPAIFYGDFSGLAINFGEDITIDVLRELFATQHALGVVAYTSFDAKVVDKQKIVCYKMATA